MKKQYITRKGTFDSGHRVMNERMKCFNIHGHTYLYELEFEFNEMEEIGYAIDFKEIKRIGCQWIDDILDHGMLLNPQDTKLIETTKEYNSKLWLMSLNGKDNYCNPSVENIAKEVFLAMVVLFQSYRNLRIHKVTIYETPNCSTICLKESISDLEAKNWMETNYEIVAQCANNKGIIEYDDRKVIDKREIGYVH
jgi:6-pyruvoyltetrahydropterin/6-carboxytetrahydropterin synthase